MAQHKKLVEGTLYEEVSSASYSENDISNSLKNGILYLEDPIDHVGLFVIGYSVIRGSTSALIPDVLCVIHRRGLHTILS